MLTARRPSRNASAFRLELGGQRGCSEPPRGRVPTGRLQNTPVAPAMRSGQRNVDLTAIRHRRAVPAPMVKTGIFRRTLARLPGGSALPPSGRRPCRAIAAWPVLTWVAQDVLDFSLGHPVAVDVRLSGFWVVVIADAHSRPSGSHSCEGTITGSIAMGLFWIPSPNGSQSAYMAFTALPAARRTDTKFGSRYSRFTSRLTCSKLLFDRQLGPSWPRPRIGSVRESMLSTPL